ncbi:hypothetical protein [Aureispira sp. CCB-QB1]|uniref:hypothetical protein n=1 Tax=Aureispira sp. CCB-QB1 TaxID=1313421 RepID=UPI0012DCA89A|nr:hypothetical protein [Aureispira sp. CCB-QB1]
MMFSYSAIDQRATILLEDKRFIKIVQQEVVKCINTSQTSKISLKDILYVAHCLTNKTLSFTTIKSSRNPNTVLKTGKANCIGYAALFNSIVNFIFQDQQLQAKYKAQHLVGKIDFLGMDLHRFFSSSFFKNHDYNVIIDLQTNKAIYIDPVISDYFYIHQISATKQ